MCLKNSIMHDAQTTPDTDITPHEGGTHKTDHEDNQGDQDNTNQTFEETTALLLSSTRNEGTPTDAWYNARERVFFIAVVLASQSYSFLLVCILAVFNNKWWIDV